MRRLLVLCALAPLAAACGSAGEPPVVAGAATTTPTAPAPAAGGLALPRCAGVPDVAAAAPVASLSPDPEIAEWQRARAEYGLPSDDAATRAAAEARPEPWSFGFPMTEAEEQAMFADNSRGGELASRVQTELGGESWFGGVWIDNFRRGVTVATTDDVDGLQADLDRRFGEGAVTAVAVARSEADLEELRDAVARWYGAQLIRSGGFGSLILKNVVSVGLEVLDPAVVADLAAAVGTDGLCVEGAEPADVIPEGPQPQAGDGWRLLADEAGAGRPYATGFAADLPALAQLWSDIGLPGDPPEVDFTTEVAVWFGPAVSGSCSDIRMDDVVIDLEAAVVRPVIVLPGGQRNCTDDANPHAYVVAIERSQLPERFTVSTDDPNEECCPEGTTDVEL